jgi:diguanylate cyclase (GGDEF)-like protein
MKTEYTKEEINQEMSCLKNTFETVRLVDPARKKVIAFDDDHPEGYAAESCSCHAIWKNGMDCFFCTSAQAVIKKGTETKIEFQDSTPYIVVSRFVCVEGDPLALEMIAPLSKDTILSAYGINKFVKLITKYNDSIYRDFLTMAYNRRFLMEKLPVLVAQADAGGLPIGIVYYDIDRLKKINDTYGHDVGDKLLSVVTRLVGHCISDRRGDFVCRIGGDEFIMVINGIDRKSFKPRLEEVAKAVEEHDFCDILGDAQDGSNITISIGGMLSSELPAGTNINAYFSKADERLYAAKKSGRNKVVVE